MRIVTVCRAHNSPGGMGGVSRDRAAALRAAGHEVHVVAPRDRRYSDEFATACVAACDKVRPDLIHLDSYDGSRIWWGDRAERVALTMHSTTWSLFLTKWCLWRAGIAGPPTTSFPSMAKQCDNMQKADLVIAISRWEQGIMQDLCGLPDARMVYNPIAPYFFDTPRRPVPAGGYVLSAGAASTRGYDVAEGAAKEIGVPFKHVRGIAREDMVDVYDRCRALVLPTARASGFDLIYAESIARGRPVIVSKLAAYRMDCLPGTCHVPIRDVQAVASAIGTANCLEIEEGAADRHRPERHAAAWLEAVR